MEGLQAIVSGNALHRRRNNNNQPKAFAQAR